MTQVIALPPRNSETAPILSRADFSKVAGREAGVHVAMELRHSPGPRRASSKRKQPDPVEAADANHPGSAEGHSAFQHLSVDTSIPLEQRAAEEKFCVCTPPPKIPRPRNSFMLYRQHHQARVSSENPKLSNPEISKIIGRRWKGESEDIREKWTKLSEEEKDRHKITYPDYEFKPAKRGRANVPEPLPTDAQGRCKECKGRPIAIAGSRAASVATPQSANARGAATLRRLETRLPPGPGMDYSPITQPSRPSQLPPVRNADLTDAMSPEMKRRRANDAGAYHLVSGMQGEYSPRPGEFGPLGSGARNPNTMTPYAPLPEIGSLPRSQSGPMPPPPLRSTAPGAWGRTSHDTRRHSGFDESLRLPPLQSSVSPSPVRTGEVQARTASSPAIESGPGPSAIPESQARNLEDAVMSLPFKQKLAILARICRPVPPVGCGRASAQTRGALIAVEGPNVRLLQEAGQVIENGLLACEEVSLKVWNSVSDGPVAHIPEKAVMPLTESGTTPLAGHLLSPCFQTLLSWQEKSNQIAYHITTEAAPRTYQGAEQEQTSSRRPSLETGKSPEERRTPTPSGKVPVALIMEGFSLTISDKLACTMPIKDAYSPVDHWQWMAALWRGTVCPDLVVYVKPSVEDEILHLGNVEFAKSMGLIVVRVPVGSTLDEATARRMAFEIMEWMREGSFRDEVPRNWRLG